MLDAVEYDWQFGFYYFRECLLILGGEKIPCNFAGFLYDPLPQLALMKSIVCVFRKMERKDILFFIFLIPPCDFVNILEWILWLQLLLKARWSKFQVRNISSFLFALYFFKLGYFSLPGVLTLFIGKNFEVPEITDLLKPVLLHLRISDFFPFDHSLGSELGLLANFTLHFQGSFSENDSMLQLIRNLTKISEVVGCESTLDCILLFSMI